LAQSFTIHSVACFVIWGQGEEFFAITHLGAISPELTMQKTWPLQVETKNFQ
jgi:hypothetical protein